MKKTLLSMVMLFVCMTAFAQDEDAQDRASWKVPTTYLNIGYVESKLKQDDFDQLKSDWGASITIGKTFFLHKKPVANFIRFGIDATWFDLSYANYKLNDFGLKETFHHAEAAMHVGPSITLTPVKGLNISGYFRYAPTFAALYSTANDNYNLGYATRFVAGGCLSYKFFGVGFESRFGINKFDPFEEFVFEDHEDIEKIKTNLKGFRVYLSFRF